MSNTDAATVSALEGEKGNGKAEMESAAAAVSGGTVKNKKRKRKQVTTNVKKNGTVEKEAAPVVAAVLGGTVKCNETRKKKEVVGVKENGAAEQEVAPVAAAVAEGTMKCNKKKRKKKKKKKKKKVVANAKENEAGEQEVAPVAAAVVEETVKCNKKKRKKKKKKKKKKVVANAKENGTVEQEVAPVAAAVVEGTVNCNKKRKKVVANAKESGAAEQEVAPVAAAVVEGTVTCNKKNRKKVVANVKKSGMAEQEVAPVAASVVEGTVKRKKNKRKKVVVNAKENGSVEEEVAPVTAAVVGGMPESKEAKAKERTMMDGEATTTSVSALNETPKCKMEEKANQRGTVEHGTPSASVSAIEGAIKCKEEKAERGMAELKATTTTVSGTPNCNKEKAKEMGMAVQEATSTTVLASEVTKKRKKTSKNKNKMQELQESAQALSDLVAVDKLVANKPENGGTDGEGTSGDADVCMDPINAEHPNCSKANDGNDKVKCKDQEGNADCSEKFSSLQEGSEDRKGQRKRLKKKRRQHASSRSPEISSQDGGRAANCCLDSLMDHDLASSLVETHKEKVENIYSPRGSLIRFQRKKLLILDLNGLLADINMDNQNAHKAHAKVKGKLVFKRPYYDEFLRFCFQNFEVGIWSSRKRENVNSVVNILMPNLKQYLLFCWDMSKCTFTGCKVIGNQHKPLVLKPLNKLWYKEDRNLPWELGEFSSSNTLLVDDSPYKALCNPPHTAIFPQPYSYLNQRDDYSLGPGGDLRVYLERLAAADDVQVFVRDNPFGQPSITESDPNWNFYETIVNKVNAGCRMKWEDKGEICLKF